MLQKDLANFAGRITFLPKCLENLNCTENMNNTVLRTVNIKVLPPSLSSTPSLLTAKTKYKDQRQKWTPGVHSLSSAHHAQRFFIKQLLSTYITKSKFSAVMAHYEIYPKLLYLDNMAVGKGWNLGQETLLLYQFDRRCFFLPAQLSLPCTPLLRESRP